MTKFFARVSSIGEYAEEFINDGILVFFADNAPEELQDYSVVHDNSHVLSNDVKPGDEICIGNESFPILAIGKVANENLRNLGHLVLKFNGINEAEMDGDVNVPLSPIPAIVVGTEIEILKSSN